MGRAIVYYFLSFQIFYLIRWLVFLVVFYHKKSFKVVSCVRFVSVTSSPWDRRVDWYQSEVQNVTYVFEWPWVPTLRICMMDRLKW